MCIIYNRLKDLNAAETQEIKRLTEIAYEKFLRDFKKSKLIVDVHKFEKLGARAKYSIHLRLEDPSILLTAEEADWELPKALHKTIANLEEEVRKKVKKEISGKSGPKPFLE